MNIVALLWLPFVLFLSEWMMASMLDYKMTFDGVMLILSFGTFLSALIFAVPYRRFRVISIGAITIVSMVIYIAQYIYRHIFGTIFILASMQATGAAVEYSEVVLAAVKKSWWGILLIIVPSIVYWIWVRKAVRELPKKARYPIACTAAFFVITLAGMGAILTDNKDAMSPRRLYLCEFAQEQSLQQFGLLPTMGLDFRFNVLHWSVNEKVNVDVSDIQVVDAFITTSPSQAPGSSYIPWTGATAEPTPEPVYEANVLPIEFDLDEENSTYQDMNAFFSEREPTTQNAYTGMFEGKNLILITAEGFCGFAIDENLTPTLYKLKTEGFSFTNFYTPVWYVSTSDGEFVETTGLIPKSGVWSYTEIADNYMPFAFGNQFRELGYSTYAYHNHTYTYYNRDRSHPNMGYDYKGIGNGLDIAQTWPESDLEMIEVTAPEYIGNGPFHVYYMTVSGHLQYNFGGNFIAAKNREYVEDLDCSTSVQAYYACQMELDFALAELLEQLEAAGELENTVIALSGDHYPYGLEEEAFEELAGKELSLPFSMFESDFILWCGDMEEPIVVDEYCSSLDIAPTLSNLFGLPYDSRLYIGTDIFAPEPNYVIFNDRSFINDRIMYDARTRTVTRLVDEEVSDAYIEQKIEYVNNLFKYSGLIIEKDYYRYLFEN